MFYTSFCVDDILWAGINGRTTVSRWCRLTVTNARNGVTIKLIVFTQQCLQHTRQWSPMLAMISLHIMTLNQLSVTKINYIRYFRHRHVINHFPITRYTADRNEHCWIGCNWLVLA